MEAVKATENRNIVWVGIDVAKNSYDAAIYLPLEPGQAPRDIINLPKAKFSRTEKSLSAFHDWTYLVRDKAGAPGSRMRIVMEATGRYSEELAAWLRKEMAFTKPVIVNPKKASDYRKSLYSGNDTDAIAAGALARFGAERQPEEAVEFPKEYKNLQELTRQRSYMVSQRTAAFNRFREIKEVKIVADVQKRLIKTLDRAIEELEIKIQACVDKYDDLRINVAYAASIKGIGLITAASVLAECGILSRYRSRQLSAYSGLSPFKHSSGTSIDYTHITRRGSKYLRQALYMPVTSVIKYNSEMRSFRQRLLDKGKTPMQARCAIMRKLLILIRALVVNENYYQENYKKN